MASTVSGYDTHVFLPRIALLAVLIASAGTVRADTSASDKQKAREHYVAAKRSFELGRFDEAIKGYEEAYRLVDEPALLYNLGQAHRLAGHNREAMRAYKNFLSRLPDAKNRDEVEKKIAQLEKVVEEQQRAQNQPPDTTIDPKKPDGETKPDPEPITAPIVAKRVVKETPRRGLLIAGGITLTVGVGAVGGGAACALLGSQTTEKLRRASVEGQAFDPKLESRGKLYNGLMGGMLAVGVVGVAAGSALLAIGMKPRRAHAWRVVPTVAANHLGIVASGNF